MSINPKDYFIVNLSEIAAPNAKIFRGNWTVPGDLPYFEGHFPKNPILPAFAIIDFSVCLISKILQKNVILQGITRAKFIDTITPNQNIRIDAQESKSDVWNISWFKEDSIVAQMQIEVLNQANG